MNEQQIENILYSAVVGDIMGIPYEFKERGSFTATKMSSGGSWEQPIGTWSDDTSFTLPLIENVTENGSYDSLMKKFENYMYDSKYTTDNQAFDIGSACAKAVRNYSVNHYQPTECGDPSEYANGNGALMRLAPLAIHLRAEADPETRFNLTKDYTNLTHRHARAILGSFIYLEILHKLLNDKELQSTLKDFPPELEDELKNHHEELAELNNYAPLFESDFKDTPLSQIKSDGYVVDTLLASVWCSLNSDTIDEAILLAVNLGDDSDTVATVTASISSCMHLDQTINQEWKNQIRNQSLLASIIVPFAEKESN